MNWLCRLFPFHGRRTSSRWTPNRNHQPRLECLEDRDLPSVVFQNTDAAPGFASHAPGLAPALQANQVVGPKVTVTAAGVSSPARSNLTASAMAASIAVISGTNQHATVT